MQGIKDSVQDKNKSVSLNTGTSAMTMPIQKNVTIFDTNEGKKNFLNDGPILAKVIIGAEAAGLAAHKGVTLFNKSSDNQVKKINEAIDEVFYKRTNLSKKGCKLINLTSMDAPELKKTPKILRFMDLRRDVVKGKNAGFAQDCNIIYTNREKMALSTFHEMGHAYNFNNVKALKTIHKARPYLMLATIAATCLPLFIKKTSPKDGQELTTGEKIKNGIHSASPLISGACFLPIVIEEGIASIRASQLAKPLLEKGVYRKMCGLNACGFSTYLASFLLLMSLAQFNKLIND